MEFDKKIGLSNSSVAPGRVYDFEIDLAANRMSWKQVFAFTLFLLFFRIYQL